jgi:hypothetical protein
MNLLSFLITISMTVSTLTFAGNEVGNGGDLLKCPNSPNVLFDFKETSINKVTLLLESAKGEEFKDEYKLAEKIIKRLEALAPRIYKKYSNDLLTFKTRTRFIEGEVFRDILDTKHVSLPKDCELLQVATQQVDPLSKDTIISINKDLYSKLDTPNKAGLILHEIIYEHFKFFSDENHVNENSKPYSEQNSVKVRMFNRYLHSKEIKTHNEKQFHDFFERLGIPSY